MKAVWAKKKRSTLRILFTTYQPNSITKVVLWKKKCNRQQIPLILPPCITMVIFLKQVYDVNFPLIHRIKTKLLYVGFKISYHLASFPSMLSQNLWDPFHVTHFFSYNHISLQAVHLTVLAGSCLCTLVTLVLLPEVSFALLFCLHNSWFSLKILFHLFTHSRIILNLKFYKFCGI